MAFEFIEVEKNERVTTVRINRPKVMNSLHPPAMKEMDEAFNDFADDPEQCSGHGHGKNVVFVK